MQMSSVFKECALFCFAFMVSEIPKFVTPRPQPTVKPLNSDALGPQIQAWTTWELFFRMSEMTRAQLQSYLAGVPGEQLIHLNPFALLMVVVAHPDLNVHGEDSVSRLVPSLLT